MSMNDIQVPKLLLEAKSLNASQSGLRSKIVKDSKTERTPTSKGFTSRTRLKYYIKPNSPSVIDFKVKGTRALQTVSSAPSTKLDDENRLKFDTLAELSKHKSHKSSSAKTLDYLRTPNQSRPRSNSAQPTVKRTLKKAIKLGQEDYSVSINNQKTSRLTDIRHGSIIVNGQPIQTFQHSPSSAYKTNGLGEYSINRSISRPNSANRSSSSLLKYTYGLDSSNMKGRTSKVYLSPSDRNKLKLRYERLNVMYSSPYGKPIRGKKIGESTCGTRYIPIQKYYLKPCHFLNDKMINIMNSSRK